MKRVFGMLEVVFDIFYLIFGIKSIFIFMKFYKQSDLISMVAFMTAILIFGDAFHLVPRIFVILSKDEVKFRPALGIGKQITSITMTIFYIFLWRISNHLYMENIDSRLDIIVYLFALIRIIICLMPQNKWKDRYPPIIWGIYRNIPFFIMGLIVSIRFFIYRHTFVALSYMYLAILLSFAFYLPVVLFSNKNPKIGMFMLPKTCMYVWIVSMFFYINK